MYYTVNESVPTAEKIMPENNAKNSLKEFIGKYVFIKPKEEKQTPLQFCMTAFACVMCFICMTVLKLPYNEENAPLLNYYYVLFFMFAVTCFTYHAFKGNEFAQKRILIILKIVAYVICCFGLYLFTFHYDYITAHISEWGGFNKVG